MAVFFVLGAQLNMPNTPGVAFVAYEAATVFIGIGFAVYLGRGLTELMERLVGPGSVPGSWRRSSTGCGCGEQISTFHRSVFSP